MAASRDPACASAAELIGAAIGDLTQNVRVEIDPDPERLRTAHGPIVLMGNLADSRCVRELYFRFLCATDRWYPGPGGYEVRTLCDPMGTGANIVHIGYSDSEGLREATGVFLNRLSDPLPGLMSIKAPRLPLAAGEVAHLLQTPLPQEAWQIGNSSIGVQKGYLYYLTGDESAGRDYRRAWEAMISCGVAKTAKIVALHLQLLGWIITWRLVEHTGLFSDEERLAIARYLHNWAESDEGVLHVDRYFQNASMPRQNHGTAPALSLAYAVDYFSTHFTEDEAPARWRAAAAKAFAPYGESWKPLCDGLCHGWWMSQPVLLDYALLEPTHEYFERGGARKAAECAVAVVNNRGWMPSAGDSSMHRQFPGPSLRTAAAYYEDGRYAFVDDLAPQNMRRAWLDHLPPPRAFDIGLEKSAPSDQIGVTVVSVDPLIFNVWRDDPEHAALAVNSPPAAPIEKCFDKLAVRSGWNLDDDYFLVDGLGGGSHSYDDAGGILDYARFGQSWIVSEDTLLFTAPEDHSALTIVRDGVTSTPPGFAILEANETDAQGNVYLRIELKDYAGADWIREIFLRPGRCAVFHDTVVAKEPGHYSIQAHFRIPDEVELHGGLLTGTRQTNRQGQVEFRLASLGDPAMLDVEQVPIHLRYSEASPGERSAEEAAAWKERYGTPHIVLSAFCARIARAMGAGESVSLTHLAQIRGPGEPELTLGQTADGLLLSDNETDWALRTYYAPRAPAPRGTRQAGAAPVGATPLPTLEAREIHRAPSEIATVAALARGGVVLGCGNGDMVALSDEGDRHEVLWRRHLDGPVLDIGVAGEDEQLVLAGHGESDLTAFTARGEELWSHTIEREPCPWPWWELPSPAPVRVVGGVHEGEPFFAVGCGDIQVRLFDARGRRVWMWRYNEGVPGRIEIADIDGDDEPEILVGGEILTDVSCCRILTPNGTLKAQLPVEGWTSRLTALSWGMIGPKHILACGANRGRNLHLYDVTDLDLRVDAALCDRRQCPEIEEEAHQRHLWEHRLGGSVTGLCVREAGQSVIVGTSRGFILCYGIEGDLMWSRMFDHAVHGVASLKCGIMIVDAAGVLTVLDDEGSPTAARDMGVGCRVVGVSSGGVRVVRGDTLWEVTTRGP